MAAHQGRIKYYSGFVELDSQPLNWIKKHRSFASHDWLFGQVKFGLWNQGRETDQFFIETKVVEGIKSVTVIIRLQLLADRVKVYHCHCHNLR
jgi:hypothetical protein